MLLVKMEEGKVKWKETHKLDRIRRAHAQKVQNNQNGNSRRFQGRDKAIPLAGDSKDLYLEMSFILIPPTIDHIAEKDLKLGKSSLFLDISRAFRHIKLDPGAYDLLEIKLLDYLLGIKLLDYFLDTCLPFGYHQGSSNFQTLSDTVSFPQ